MDGEQVRIGSAHFIFEDEQVTIPEGEQAKFDTLPPEYSQLYLAINGVLSAVICISDPLREEAREVLSALWGLGVRALNTDATTATISAQAAVATQKRWRKSNSIHPPKNMKRPLRSSVSP